MIINSLFELVLLVSALACGVRSAPVIDAVNANITSQLFQGDIAGFDRSLLNGNDKTLSKIPDDEGLLWKNGIVYYRINQNDYDDQEIEAILAGMKMIEDATRLNGKDCIKFQKRRSEDNFLYIYSGNGCFTRVGRDIVDGPQLFSLAAGDCTLPGIAAHEFLHSLGFWHEQSRPDRDNYITIQWDNIPEEMSDNFEKYTTEIDTLGLPYDFESIMHSDAYAYAVDDSKPTIVSKKKGVSFGQREKLSKLDIEAVRKLYHCI